MAASVDLQQVYRARARIASLARRTPLIPASGLSAQVGGQVYLKLENLQPTGAFKLRGAANKIRAQVESGPVDGVITVSTGNHGRAVAYVARAEGLPAVVCLSEEVPQNKVDAIRQLSAELVIHGRSQDDAFKQAAQVQAQRGLVLIPPFDDPEIIAGQGTIGLELLEDLPQLDTAIVPLSGGGLIAGIALVLKSANPAIQVLGVSMQRGPAMYHSLKAGKPVLVPEEATLADSLRGGIGLANRYTFHMVQQLVDDVILVSEEEIAEAMVYAFEQHHLVLEGAAAVGIAALRSGSVDGAGRQIALVLSGGNVDLDELVKIWMEQR